MVLEEDNFMERDILEIATAGNKRRRLETTSGDHGVPLEDRVCPFCFKGHQDGLKFSKDFIDILNDSTVWATDKPTFVSCGRPYWVHSVCVTFCPLTRYDESTNSWLGVSREYHRARCLMCSECKRKGASIGCEVPTCNVSCHFPCAVQAVIPETGEKNWFPCQDPETPFFCPAHREERAQRVLVKEIRKLEDLSRGKEAVPIPLKQGLASVGDDSLATASGRSYSADATVAKARAQWQLLMKQIPLPRGIRSEVRDADFVYVEDTVGSKSAAVSKGFERSKRCCSCSGPKACRDPRECECLRDGRNYRSKGRRLDNGHPAQIYECNLNCSCHVKSCRNRLVQKGMTCKIDVAYLGPSHRFVEGYDKTWGVRTVKDIAVGTFVCKLAGQLVSAGSIEGVVNTHGEHSSVLVHRVKDWTGELTSGPGFDEDELASSRHEEVLLDQRNYANISRYIRCAHRPEDANLVGVAVQTEDQDPKAPVMALFAATNIPAGAELVRSRLLSAGAGGLPCALSR